jgi:hypothetical protein
MAASAVLLNPKAPEFQMPSLNPNAPEFKPVGESSLTLRPDAAEFIPMAGGLYTLQAVTEAYQNKQKRAMPWASDEEWEQRILKREKEVETIKSLQSYRLYIEVFPHDRRSDDDPKTPDPRDRTVSKRMWKWNVEKWRLQLKSRCVYSRSVLLQCYAELQRREDTDRPGSASAAAASDEAVAGEVASAGQGESANSTSVRKHANECLRQVPYHLKTVAIPDQPVTIPGSSRKGVNIDKGGYKSGSSSTFQ